MKSDAQRRFRSAMRSVVRTLQPHGARLAGETYHQLFKARADAIVQCDGALIWCSLEFGSSLYAVALAAERPWRLITELLDERPGVPDPSDVEAAFGAYATVHAGRYGAVIEALQRFESETLDIADVFAKGVNRPDEATQLAAACAINHNDAARILRVRQTGSINSVPDDKNLTALFTFSRERLARYIESTGGLAQRLVDFSAENRVFPTVFFNREWNGFHVGLMRQSGTEHVTVHHTIVDGAVDFVLASWNMRGLS